MQIPRLNKLALLVVCTLSSCFLPFTGYVLAAPNGISVQLVDQSGAAIEHALVVIPDIAVQGSTTQSAIMDQKNKAFVPSVLAVDQNTLISFPNSDNIRHHVYSFSKAKRFEIKLYADTPESPLLFDEPGVVVLGCNIHDSMVGYIFVSKWEHYSLTDDAGIGRIEYTGSLPNELLIWHPRLADHTEPVRVASLSWKENNAKIKLELKPVPKKKKSRFR